MPSLSPISPELLQRTRALVHETNPKHWIDRHTHTTAAIRNILAKASSIVRLSFADEQLTVMHLSTLYQMLTSFTFVYHDEPDKRAYPVVNTTGFMKTSPSPSSAFTNLQQLELSAKTNECARVLPVLASFSSLSHRTINEYIDIKDAELQVLFTGPNKRTRLKELELDVMFHADGVDRDSDTYQLRPTIVDERWSLDCTIEGIQDLIALAKEAGVKLTGYPVEEVRAEGEEDRLLVCFAVALLA
ncbi:hypothetical protein JCM11641_006436 [Rhodosporidiobolus odoratus]